MFRKIHSPPVTLTKGVNTDDPVWEILARASELRFGAKPTRCVRLLLQFTVAVTVNSTRSDTQRRCCCSEQAARACVSVLNGSCGPPVLPSDPSVSSTQKALPLNGGRIPERP